MTPTQILALVKDGLIVAAIAFVLYKVYNAGENQIKVADMQAVQTELQHQKTQLQQYVKQVTDANDKRAQDAQKITDIVSAHNQPVIVRVPSGPNPVPTVSNQACSAPAQSGGSDAGRGINLRPAITALELKYESALADCRLLDNAWPSQPNAGN